MKNYDKLRKNVERVRKILRDCSIGSAAIFCFFLGKVISNPHNELSIFFSVVSIVSSLSYMAGYLLIDNCLKEESENL